MTGSIANGRSPRKLSGRMHPGLLPQRSYLLVLGFLLCTLSPFAQNSYEPAKGGRFGLSTGWMQSLLADQHASPLLYRANTAQVGMIYRYHSNFMFEVALSIAIGSNQSRRFGKRTTTVSDTPDIHGTPSSYEVELNPFLSMLNAELEIKMSWEMGNVHQLGVSFHARHFTTGIGGGTSYYTQLDLAPTYQYAQTLNNKRLYANLSLPLVAALVRPTFSKDAALPDVTSYWWGYVKTNTRFTSIHQLLNPSAQIGLSWSLANGDDIGINYTGRWLSYPLPRPIRLFEHGLALNYLF